MNFVVRIIGAGLLFVLLSCCSGGKKKPTIYKQGAVVLYYTPRPGAVVNSVFVSGSFNNWKMFDNKFKMEWDRFEKRFFLTLILQTGRYEYKFIVNGEWVVDPNARAKKDDPLGGKIGLFDVVK